MATWGTVDDFRHILPRILELVAIDGGNDWIDVEVAFGKLDYGHWQTWPSAERLAVERFCNAWWADVVDAHPSQVGPESALCAIAQVVADVGPYLSAWRPDRSRASAMQLAEWVSDVNCGGGVKPMGGWHMRNPWWTGRPAASRQAAEWLLSADRVAELERAFFAFGTDAATAEALSYAVTELQSLWASIGVIVDPPERP